MVDYKKVYDKKEIKKILNKVFVDEKTYESVVTTSGTRARRGPNAATMNLVKEKDILHLEIHKGTNTFINVRFHKRFGINILTKDNLPIIIRAALSGWGSEKHDFAFEDYSHIRGLPILKDSFVQFDCRVLEWRESYGIDDLGPYHIGKASAEVIEVRYTPPEPKKAMKADEEGLLEVLALARRHHFSDDKASKKIKKDLNTLIEKLKKSGDDKQKKALDLLKSYLGKK
jgi:hypothetical protein